MAYTDYAFDPTGELAANGIVETQDVDISSNIMVMPLQGAFFADSLSVRARTGSDAWRDLLPNKDYVYSPLFLEASARTTRQAIHSYIVLIDTAATDDEVELTYQCLGQYQDDKLLAEIALSGLDRSKPWEWAAIRGNAQSFQPKAREESLKDASSLEKLNEYLELIVQHIADPYSGAKNYSQDIARLEGKVGKALGLDAYNAKLKENDHGNAVTNSVAVTLKTTPAGVVAHSGMLYFRASDNHVFSADISAVLTDGAAELNTRHLVTTNGAIVSITVSRSGDRMILQATPSVDGTLYYKTISEIWE